ncbi:MAG TPA: PhnD/SsuA/transferrin family substrate-binding protein [Gemmataceae bacterium]|nr:PhnD/SsuA/transferrin family substrate-binding protein [Gemmataceae bacterium]
MFCHEVRVVAAAAIALGVAVQAPAPSAAKDKVSLPPVIHIGINHSLFRDIPRALALVLMEPFGGLMKSMTELDSELSDGGDGLQLGQQLADDKVQLGLFQGIEFAWARQKYPKLRPLMLIINRKPYHRAYLVVNATSKIGGFADLKGQVVGIPRMSHEHCYQFLSRYCRQQHTDTQHFLTKLAKPSTTEAGLDNVADGKLQAAIVEEVPLECYKRRKPGRFRLLKVVQHSEIFPASVVAYYDGRLDQQTLKNLRSGMLGAPNTAIGRQLLNLWRMTGFAPIPDDFAKQVEDIVKAYPAPQGDSKPPAKAASAGTPGSAGR